MSLTAIENASLSESRLIQKIYQASSQSESWASFMHDLVEVLDGRSARVLQMNDWADEVHSSYVINHDDDYLKQYVDYYVNKCPWRLELANKPKGLLYSTYLDFSCKQNAFKKTEFYNDWAKPQNIEHGICGTVFQQQGKTVQMLVQRTDQAGDFTRQETEFVNRLVPHIQNAIHLSENIESMRAVEYSVTALADRFSQPFALLDEKMNIRFISQLMKQTIEQSKGLKLASDKLLAADSSENAKLYHMLKQCLMTAMGAGSSGGGVMRILADYDDGLRLKVIPFPADLSHGHGLFNRAFVVVFLTSSKLNFSLAREQLSIQFNLTERESQLAALLCEGLSVDQIAEFNGVKTSTLRKQLKSVYMKTNTHRQGELIVTLLNSLASQRVL